MKDQEFISEAIDVISQERHKRGWTQAMLAEKAGMARVSVGRFECEMCNPSLASLVLLLDVLGYELKI